MPSRLQRFVMQELKVTERESFVQKGLIGLSDTNQLIVADRLIEATVPLPETTIPIPSGERAAGHTTCLCELLRGIAWRGSIENNLSWGLQDFQRREFDPLG